MLVLSARARDPGTKVALVSDALKALPATGKTPDARYAPYVPRLFKDLQANLEYSSRGQE